MPQILLISAHEALLARMELLGRSTPESRKKFARKVWGWFGSSREHSEAECKQAAAAMLAASGLPELEANLLGYLYNHAGALKLVSTLDDIISLLNEVSGRV